MDNRLIFLYRVTATKTQWGDGQPQVGRRVVVSVQTRGGAVGKSAATTPGGYVERLARTDRRLFQENPLASRQSSVPQTDTGRWGEQPKALERTIVKELGKMSP